jgi:hypothetical protein
MNRVRTLGALALAILSAACGSQNDSPTGPTPVTFSTRFFSDVIDDGGSRTFPFRVSVSGPVVVTLASVTNAATGAPLALRLRLGIGRPDENGCVLDTSATASAALVSQLTYLAPVGDNCLEVADTSGANIPLRFAVRFTHP